MKCSLQQSISYGYKGIFEKSKRKVVKIFAFRQDIDTIIFRSQQETVSLKQSRTTSIIQSYKVLIQSPERKGHSLKRITVNFISFLPIYGK